MTSTVVRENVIQPVRRAMLLLIGIPLVAWACFPDVACAQQAAPGPDASLKDLLAYTDKQVGECKPLLGKPRAQGEDLEKVLAVVSLCDRILEGEVNDATRVWVLRRKGVLLEALTRWQPGGYAEGLKKVADELEVFLESHPKAVPTWTALAATIIKSEAYRLRGGGQRVETTEYDGIIDRLYRFILREEDTEKGRNAIRYLSEFVRQLPPAKRDDFLLRMVRVLAPYYQESEFLGQRLYGEELAGLGRRIELTGNKMFLEGYFDQDNKLDPRTLRGKVVLVDFWETTCAPCMQQMPDLIRIYEQYKPLGFEIVGVAATENQSTVRIFLQSKTFGDGLRMTWPVIVDAIAAGKKEKTVSGEYGVVAFPTMFLIGRDGNVISTDIDIRTLTQEIDKALDAKSAPARPNRPETIPSPP